VGFPTSRLVYVARSTEDTTPVGDTQVTSAPGCGPVVGRVPFDQLNLGPFVALVGPRQKGGHLVDDAPARPAHAARPT
jgi:hypothetical protein